jgi:hypothetical protein
MAKGPLDKAHCGPCVVFDHAVELHACMLWAVHASTGPSGCRLAAVWQSACMGQGMIQPPTGYTPGLRAIEISNHSAGKAALCLACLVVWVTESSGPDGTKPPTDQGACDQVSASQWECV